MEWRCNYVDVSSCMLFETIGDSEEADSNFNHNDDIGGSIYEERSGLAEDDAYSCSCETHEYCKDFDHPTGDDCVYVDDDHNEEENVGYEYYEDEEDAVDQVVIDDIKVLKGNREWESEEGLTVTRTKKLKVCCSEFLNEPDKDRHFWETCLAS
ncbi:hypothetical protein ACH5RR_020093 [Cinchona calisaya]|uniref:Uncharacterized protein n=1 Tax=Cinchona calisaya TaxID=153742 RepID=A0ABD2ZEI8_9GENT